MRITIKATDKSIKQLFFIMLVLVFQIANAKNYYVSPNGNDLNTGITQNTPYRTIQKAADLTLPGDTVFVMNGTFTTSSSFLTVNRSGTSTEWIVYQALKGHSPKVKVSGSVWATVTISADYIVFEGIELEGDLQNLNLADAEDAEAHAENGGNDWNRYAIYNNSGITLGGNSSLGNHHMIVRNCRIHDFPGSGISGIKSDYVTVENNEVYNVNWYTMYAGSAISLWHTYNSDMKTGYKNFVRRNICYNSKTLVNWVVTKSLSDGNGIIIDDNRQTQDGKLGTAYVGHTLVENNICFNNGGSGIHAYSSNNVDIINNTTFNNGTVVGYPEIFQNSAKDGIVMNNIIYARDGGEVNSNYNTNNVIYDYNIYFNGSYEVKGEHDKVIDPMFINPTIDPDLADFHLQNGSPAIDFGSTTLRSPAAAPYSDFEGNSRPQGNGIDAGAYESPYHSNMNVCHLISPADGESFDEGLNINLVAFATAENALISKVEFYEGITKMGESISYPYSFLWPNPSTGEYIVSAHAYDENDNIKISEKKLFRVTSSEPTELIMNGEFVDGKDYWESDEWGASLSFVIDESSVLSGIESAHLKVNGVGEFDYQGQLEQKNISLVEGKEYVLAFSAKSSGDRTMPVWIQNNDAPWAMCFQEEVSVKTEAQDFGPFLYTSEVTTERAALKFILGGFLGEVWIDNVSLTSLTGTATPKPECNILSPESGKVLERPALIDIQATADVSTGTISEVEFYANNQLLGTENSEPYSYTWRDFTTGDYLLTAVATDANGNVATSSVIPISVVNVSGINKIKKQSVGISPNPANEYFIVQSPADELVKSVKVYNILGQQILEVKESSQINIGSLTPDIYLVKITTSLKVHTFKFLKN